MVPNAVKYSRCVHDDSILVERHGAECCRVFSLYL